MRHAQVSGMISTQATQRGLQLKSCDAFQDEQQRNHRDAIQAGHMPARGNTTPAGGHVAHFPPSPWSVHLHGPGSGSGPGPVYHVSGR